MGKSEFKFTDCFADGSGISEPPPLDSSDFESLLLPAPALNGTDGNLAILKYSQRSRTPEQVIAQWAFISSKNIFAYNAALGANLERDAPTFAKCITSFSKPIKAVKNEFKEMVQRQRPFLSHPDLKPCLPAEFSFSYPSGHATFYSSTPEFLSAVFPDLKERVAQVGTAGVFARSKCGVHYPSDVDAGQMLGRSAASQIMETLE